jgi:transcriptional regulator with XRE-family HTH domain
MKSSKGDGRPPEPKTLKISENNRSKNIMVSKFGEFLYQLRKEQGLTQSELADKLGITNKAVSKWETGEAFPETSQLVPLAGIFGISVDELLKGERIASTGSDYTPPYKEETYAKPEPPMTKKQAITTVIGIATILLGVLITVILNFLNVSDEIAAVPLLLMIGVGVFMLTQMGMNKDLVDSQISEDQFKAGKRAALQISSGIFIVIIAVMLLILLSNLVPEYVYFTIFFVMLIIGVSLLIYGGIMLDTAKKKGNAKSSDPVLPEKKEQIVGGICGGIMLTATAVFLLLGFFKGMWHPGWVVFPVGGILCGIISTIANGVWGKK